MLENLAAGTILVIATSIVHAVGLLALSRGLKSLVQFHLEIGKPLRMITLMLFTVLGLFALHSAEIWLWALSYLALGAFSNIYDALFFSTLSFSTLGAELISLPEEWGLLGSIEGVDGFLLIGWSTAYLFAAWTRYGPLSWDETS